MSMGKIKLETRENLLLSAFLAIAFIFLADLALPEILLGFRALAGIYLYFYPLGALALQALRVKTENAMEKIVLSAFASISWIALSQLGLHLAFNIPFTLYTLMTVIAVSALGLYFLGGWKKA